jgi:hypothetical protein
MSQPPIEDKSLSGVLMNISWIKTTEGVFRFSSIDALTPPENEENACWVLTVSGEPIFLDIEEAVEIEKLLKPCIDVRGSKVTSTEQTLHDILSQPSAAEPAFEYFKSKGFDAKIVSVFDKVKRSTHTYVLYLLIDGKPCTKCTALSIAQCLRKGIEFVTNYNNNK